MTVVPPLVSVITGTYNQERHVREALESLFAQTYTAFESIVVDDASTDRTVEVVRSFGDRVQLHVRDKNSGLCQYTRNEGVRRSRGKYIAFLDHDDAWLPEKLARQVEFMEAHPDIMLSHTYAEVMDENSKTVGIRHEGVLPPTGDCFNALLRHCFITISSVMVRRELFDRIGMFTEDPTLLNEDYEFFLRAAKSGPIGLVNKVLTRYRKSSASMTRRYWRSRPRAVQFYIRILRHPDLWRDETTPAIVRGVLAEACHENCVFWRDHGWGGRSAWYAWQGLRRWPWQIPWWIEFGKGSLSMLTRTPAEFESGAATKGV